MNKRHLYALVTTLSLVGVVMFGYKVFFLKYPIEPLTEINAWEVGVSINFRAKNLPTKVSLYIPRPGGAYTAVDEQFISRDFGMNIRNSDSNRQVIWSVRKASGEKFLYFKTVIRPAAIHEEAPTDKPQKVIAPEFEGPNLVAAGTLLADVQAHSADNETLVSELIKRFGTPSSDDKVAVLVGKNKSIEERLYMIVKVLAMANIPARTVHGIRLERFKRDAKFMHWLEVHQMGRWQGYDPRTGQPYFDSDVLPWWHGDKKLVNVTGGDRVNSQVSVSLSKEPALLGAIWREQQIRPLLSKYSLLNLPIETQSVYQILLTVPVGIFLLVVLRNIIGIKTFGTFMPVLIGLAFRETQLFWGVILFSLVVGLGLAVRFYLEHLKLLLVPRLAAVLIVVVILMSFISIFSYQMGMYRGLSVALFPMVILAMTIERMSVVWEERGPIEAFQQGLGSLFVATMAYVVMTLEIVQHLVLLFPELLLVVLAATLLLGRYSGYRLSELFRFKVLARGHK